MMTTAESSFMQPLSMRLNDIDNSLNEPVGDSRIPDSAQEPSITSDTECHERELLNLLRQGDEGAFGSLVDRYHTRFLRLARAYVPSEAVAEEVVQETWVGVLEGIHRFEGRSSLKTWIFQILSNRAKTRGKRESRYVSFSEATPPGDQEEDLALEPERFHASGALAGHWALPPTTWDEQTPERLLLSQESMAHVEHAIHTLPANQRQVIILRDIEGMDSEEICTLLHITQSNQRVLLHRARTKVRRILDDYLQDSSPKA